MVFYLSVILYVVARIALLALPLLTLIDLPDEVYRVVGWTTAISHL